VEIPSVVTKAELMEAKVERILTTLSKMNLDTLTDHAIHLMSTADSSLQNVELEKTLIALRRTLQKTSHAFDRLDKQIDPLAEGILATNKDIQTAISSLNELIKRLDQISLENRYQFSQTIKELKTATRAIRDLAEQIERNPESILFGKD
jgi:ABC-type transporter Mla subunit MlaD